MASADVVLTSFDRPTFHKVNFVTNHCGKFILKFNQPEQIRLLSDNFPHQFTVGLLPGKSKKAVGSGRGPHGFISISSSDQQWTNPSLMSFHHHQFLIALCFFISDPLISE